MTTKVKTQCCYKDKCIDAGDYYKCPTCIHNEKRSYYRHYDPQPYYPWYPVYPWDYQPYIPHSPWPVTYTTTPAEIILLDDGVSQSYYAKG
ncbi:hypothetical protein LCGC14_0488720 [marine sediment metagenome]|uniref:Uncharacterized protein n=1 Tax=marine sediment metagenome TaxID=412755 RepID=A0A0F9S750_9ZZZZ